MLQDLIRAIMRLKRMRLACLVLLVKSAQQMIITAQDLKAAGISAPILVGGAALTRKFTENRISPEYDGLVLYAKDAMNGLDLSRPNYGSGTT